MSAPSELTQEELAVNEGLQSLECSQDANYTNSDKKARSLSASPFRWAGSGLESDDDSYTVLKEQDDFLGLRRSTRTVKEVDRYQPNTSSQPPRGSSVFGSVFGATKRSGAEMEMRMALREVTACAQEEKRLEEMRQRVSTTGENEEEDEYEGMAKAESHAESLRQQAFNKYSAPVPLFSRPVKLPKFPKSYTRKSKPQHANSLHDLFLEAFAGGEDADFAFLLLLPCIDRLCKEQQQFISVPIADILFHLVVFDNTNTTPGHVSRDKLIDGIIQIVESNVRKFRTGPKLPKLPPIVSVFEKYGAVFWDTSTPTSSEEIEQDPESLDMQVPSEDSGEVGDTFLRSVRNLQRACKLASLQIRAGVPVHLVFVQDGTLSSLKCLDICVQILLSAFGCRLYREVGEIINEIVDGVEKGDWPQFRLKAAEGIVSLTTRLELHVELVSHLLPYDRKRSRHLSMDVTFMSLKQWCHAPDNKPEARSIKNTCPSSQALKSGVGMVSFCIGDIIELLKELPEMGKDTDVVWASLISKQLKMLFSEPKLLGKREVGELGVLNQMVQKLRICAHRMRLEVEVQHMRMALDSLIKAIRDFGESTKAGRAEIIPNAGEDKKQVSLSAMMRA